MSGRGPFSADRRGSAWAGTCCWRGCISHHNLIASRALSRAVGT